MLGRIDENMVMRTFPPAPSDYNVGGETDPGRCARILGNIVIRVGGVDRSRSENSRQCLEFSELI